METVAHTRRPFLDGLVPPCNMPVSSICFNSGVPIQQLPRETPVLNPQHDRLQLVEVSPVRRVQPYGALFVFRVLIVAQELVQDDGRGSWGRPRVLTF